MDGIELQQMRRSLAATLQLIDVYHFDFWSAIRRAHGEPSHPTEAVNCDLRFH
jgi:hypothetical protein